MTGSCERLWAINRVACCILIMYWAYTENSENQLKVSFTYFWVANPVEILG